MKQHMLFELLLLGSVLVLVTCFLVRAVTGIHWLIFDHFQEMGF